MGEVLEFIKGFDLHTIITLVVIGYLYAKHFDKKFESIEQRFKNIEERFKTIENRLNSIENRLTAIETTLRMKEWFYGQQSEDMKEK